MGIARRPGAGNSTWLNNPNTQISLTMSWGLASLGDRVIAMVTTNAVSSTLTGASGGWTTLGSYRPTTTMSQAAYYKDYTVEDPTPVSYTWTAAVSGRMTVAYVVYSGCDLTKAPIFAANPSLVGNRTSSTPATAVTDQDLVVGFTSARQSPGDAAAISWTPTAPAVEVYDIRAEAAGTTQQLTTNIYESGPLPAGSVTLSTVANKDMAEANTWSIRLQPPTAAAGWRVGVPIR